MVGREQRRNGGGERRRERRREDREEARGLGRVAGLRAGLAAEGRRGVRGRRRGRRQQRGPEGCGHLGAAVEAVAAEGAALSVVLWEVGVRAAARRPCAPSGDTRSPATCPRDWHQSINQSHLRERADQRGTEVGSNGDLREKDSILRGVQDFEPAGPEAADVEDGRPPALGCALDLS